jgi:hypothetical protein
MRDALFVGGYKVADNYPLPSPKSKQVNDNRLSQYTF